MLEQLLSLVAEGGVFTLEEMAERLPASQSLVKAMLEDLVRLGYLREVAGGCAGHSGGCRACSMGGGCLVTGAGQVWSLTEKGARAVPRPMPGTP